MLAMHRDGVIVLPPPKGRQGRPKPIFFGPDTEPPLFPAPTALDEVRPLDFRTVVRGTREGRLWNEFVARYHYLGYKPLVGAQMRYAVHDRNGWPLAMLGFSTAAWKLAPRDNFIGWTPELRGKNLPLVVDGPLKDILAQVEIGILPPWELPEPVVTEEELISQILSSQPLIDLDDELFSRDDVDDNFKDLFAIYKGLLRVGDLTDFALNNSKADNMRPILQSQFDSYVEQIKAYMEPLNFTDITLIEGLRQASTEATLEYPASNLTDVHFGQMIATVRDDPVVGITGTETFSILVTRADLTTETVNVDLANVSGTLNVDNIVAEINTQLAAGSGIGTTFGVERYDEFSYGLRVDFSAGESIEMTPGASEGALFVGGTAGAGDSPAASSSSSTI